MKYILKDKGNVYDLIPNLNQITNNADEHIELTQTELDKLLIDLRPYITIGGYVKNDEVKLLIMNASHTSKFKINWDISDEIYNNKEMLHKHLMAAGGTVNSNKTEDDLWEATLNDKNEPSIDEEPSSIIAKDLTGPQKATLNPITVRYLQWNDNLSEMKMFCGEDCIITYECAPGLDCYWMLVVDTINKDGYTSVPLGHYVIKLSEGFIVVSPHTFKKYFNVGGKES